MTYMQKAACCRSCLCRTRSANPRMIGQCRTRECLRRVNLDSPFVNLSKKAQQSARLLERKSCSPSCWPVP
ncbi:uncharacterized protein B0I36DRAFT_325722 [Microdochium trichocladiopsis]|uniref:Uncharacterized protein n=1 Tax=Microdochium trichocladiopsis TaxID=1682393 RepID=A0A9P9BPN4_9PEZI|nr:uncharacterized protein B0I36DRAFT_325722 [Microdochium trichocladiopsis]KAH7029412.1 hypothetical protein B0I36DRAFT_325722 [Microdochium trichocladiopsis]